MLLFDWDEDYLRYVLSNVMVLKAMHDRGYDVEGIPPDEESILSPCLNRIFGNVRWADVVPEYDEDFALALGDEDDERRCAYEDFHSRYHYKLVIPIPEVAELWPFSAGELALLEEKLRKFVIDPNEIFEEGYLPDYAFYRWEWLEDGRGVCLYMYDIYEGCESPPESLEVLGILEFLDTLRDIKQKRKESAA